ncbi:MAG: DUF488 domain-containing protein [Candidatus Bathycorpusculaceae bacterium]
MRIYTLGHSTRSFEEFVEILKTFGVELVVDVRRFPGSRKFPHFSKENLEKELAKVNIRYVHISELGGYRKEGYLAFSQTEEFTEAIERLLEIIGEKTAVILCAEILWWRCHRRYIANALSQMGHQTIHIFDKKKTQEHKPREKEIEEKMKLKIFCDKIPKSHLSLTSKSAHNSS